MNLGVSETHISKFILTLGSDGEEYNGEEYVEQINPVLRPIINTNKISDPN